MSLLRVSVLLAAAACTAGIRADFGIVLLTAVCAAVAIASGMGERGARSVFLAVVALFLAVLFTYLILLQGVPPLFASPCPPTIGP